VRVNYQLADDGSIARCAVTRTSGNPSIDAATCRILLERARIRPDRRSMRGALQFTWPGEAAPDDNPRGAPIQLGFIETISADRDYPAEAIRRRESGELAYDVDVSEDGAPLGCTIIRSSGSEALDRRTCELIMTRCLFIPAADGAGGRRRGVYHGRFRWRM
jgi:TonB family protein